MALALKFVGTAAAGAAEATAGTRATRQAAADVPTMPCIAFEVRLIHVPF
jgi:hypothetical protein